MTGRAAGARRRLSIARVAVALVLVAGTGVAAVAGAERIGQVDPVPADPWFAPYVDLTLTPSYAFEDPTVNPSDDVVLGFVVADAEDPCTPSWGGAYTLDSAATGLDLDRRLARFRRDGGDAIASFGGAANEELAVACDDDDALVEAYAAVVERYELTTIDLDIEGDALDDRAATVRRARAVAAVQAGARAEGRPLAVWLTLPVSPEGLPAEAVEVVDEMLAAGVDLGGVNVMTMNYGASRPDDLSMADAAEAALRATHDQLGAALRRADLHLDDTALWARVGATPMIGQNDVTAETTTLADAERLTAFAVEHGLGRVSTWSANRDAPCSRATRPGPVDNTCSGVDQEAGGFAAALEDLSGRPVSTADRRTADDAAETVVDDPATSPYPIWDADVVYEAGDKVVLGGEVHAAQWWTRGDEPGAAAGAPAGPQPWRWVGPVLPDDRPAPTTTIASGTHAPWDEDEVYEEGAVVEHRGAGHRAAWWTSGDEPGVDLDDNGQSPWRPLGATN